MKKAGEFHLLEVLEELQQEININIIGPLSKNKDAIVVIMDQFTKMIRLKVTTMTVSSKKIAKIYQDKIWKLYGIPKIILSDRERQFTSKFMKDLTKALCTKKTLLTAYYSQIDSQTE